MDERLNPKPREIKFGGEKAESIKLGFAITTLRNPKPDYDFSRGEKILTDCFDDGEKVPVTVITNEIQQLKNFSIPQLALDGFFSVRMAADIMKSYRGYEKTNKNSIMQAITFVKEESFNALSQDMKDEIIYGHFDELVRIPALRPLFFSTMCLHFSNYGGAKEWIEFLGINKLISGEEKLKMENYEIGGRNISELLENHTNIFQKLAIDTKASFFRPMILGLFDEPTEVTPKG